jgi:hypothetical protein
MITRLPTAVIISLFISLLGINTVYAEFDVDDADSLDFESFHKEKNPVIKTYEKNSDNASPQPAATDDQEADVKTSNEQAALIPKAVKSRYEIRQRFTTGKSDNTSDGPLQAIDALYKKMATHCPNGWSKEKEWSVPIEGDFYLHYQFNCRD